MFAVGPFQLNYPTLPYPTLPYPTLPYPTLPYPTLPYPILSYPILSYPILLSSKYCVPCGNLLLNSGAKSLVSSGYLDLDSTVT